MKIRLVPTASGFSAASAVVFVALLIAGTPRSAGDTTAVIALDQDDVAHNVLNLVDAKGIDLTGSGNLWERGTGGDRRQRRKAYGQWVRQWPACGFGHPYNNRMLEYLNRG